MSPLGSYAFIEAQNNLLGMSIVPEMPLCIGGIITDAGAALIFSAFVITIISFANRRKK